MRKLSKFVKVESKAPDDQVDYLLCLALDIGETMMKNGAEIHRVEDTVERLCKAYGAVHTEIFAIPTMIIAAVRMEDGSYSSQLRTVKGTSNNMHMVEIFNDISRLACTNTPPLPELDAMIKTSKKRKTYPYWLVVIGSALVTGAFCVYFGGTWRDALAAAFIGAILALSEKIPTGTVNDFAKITLQSFLGGAMACIFVWLGVGQSADKVIMGSIMYAVPGLTLGIAMRDLFYGDYIAGSLKVIQALLIALMIALGYFLAMLAFRGVL